MSRGRASPDDIRAITRLAGLELSPEYFDELCRAYQAVEPVLDRLPTDLPPAAEPGHVFDPRSFMPKGART